jgi:hypothetical protein
MGLREDFLAKLAELKVSAEARQAALVSGRPARVINAEELAKGHPKVSAEAGFHATAYETRLSSCFGWTWLIFTSVHCVASFMVAQAHWWHYFLFGLFYVPFFLVGFAFSIARYRVILTDAEVTVLWRVLPYLGWTWTLPVGDEVKVSLAFRGSESNDEPVEAIVVSSLGKDIDFGAFLPLDVKEHLAAAIRYYYEGDSAPFVEERGDRR